MIRGPVADSALDDALGGVYADLAAEGEISTVAAQQMSAAESGRRGNQAGRGACKAHPQYGEHNGQSKLINRRVRRIRDLSAQGWRATEIARELGVHHSTVSSVLHREYWSHVDGGGSA